MFRPTPNITVALSQRQLATGRWHVDQVPDGLGQSMLQLGWNVIELNLSAATTKEQLLDELGEAGDFPAHYGRNWDAAADCLTELCTPLLIVVRGAQAWADANSNDASVLADIIDDTVVWFAGASEAVYGIWEGRPATADQLSFDRL